MTHRILTTLLFTMLSFQAWAEPMCDDVCSATIDFPNGGTLTATEAMTIHFGSNGTIDTISTLTAYNNESFSLNAGETIDFGVDGYIDIGEAGNMEFTDLSFDADEVIFTITAEGETETITILGITSTGDFTLNADTGNLTLGSFDIGGDAWIISSDSISQTSDGFIIVAGNLYIEAENATPQENNNGSGDSGSSSGVIITNSGVLTITSDINVEPIHTISYCGTCNASGIGDIQTPAFIEEEQQINNQNKSQIPKNQGALLFFNVLLLLALRKRFIQ